MGKALKTLKIEWVPLERGRSRDVILLLLLPARCLLPSFPPSALQAPAAVWMLLIRAGSLGRDGE